MTVGTVLMYAQDTKGLGHIRRSLTIARSLLRMSDDVSVVLATRSQWPAAFTPAERFEVLSLPSRPLDPGSADGQHLRRAAADRAERAAVLRDAVLARRPDVILIDNEPLGVKGEMRDAIEAAPPSTRLVYGMRDVVDIPERTHAKWAELGALDVLRRRFERILVYGHPELFDTLGTYELGPELVARAAYNRYVCAPPERIDGAGFRERHGLGDEPFVLATGGGGIDAFPVLRLAVDAARLLPARPRLLLVTGPLMPDEDRAAADDLAARDGHLVATEVEMLPALAEAAAAVTMGGYNTVIEALMLGRRPIIVPRATHKQEQLIRARAFAARDLVRYLEPEATTPETLAGALAAELAGRGRIDASPYLDLHGERAATTLLGLLA